ncbi:hypothetical protein EV361DRAFT_927257 [Lentinula raphanica]|uniref:Transcription factor BYE1 n=1 Tax=Lentinula raphanica TaxID=153919 RepID=A0AA38PB72_9AGAR|nr:hypothetical protein F5880DRAFT_389835 [Lentinula raphanica]KAJ3839694.1 hypothetical protein F5878DRAFT_615528 [Lentinula raphanica]KAJ3968178.1 hypothetical protein EV361DRAFT_927257 [Lentinula raphanica]
MSTRTTRSTRTNTKQAAATAATRSSAPPSKTSKSSHKLQDSGSQSGKENKNAKNASPSVVAQVKNLSEKDREVSTPASDKVYCTCRKGDDGTPMIHCSQCNDWLHFSCVSLDETDAEDISVYVCPTCSEKTGLHTLMTWEESDLIEDSKNSASTGPSKPRKKSKTPKEEEPLPEPEPEPSSASEGSDDNYVAEPKVKGGKRRPRRASYLSDTDHSDDEKPAPRIRKASSPSLKRLTKRPSDDGPPAKKAKTSSSGDDPARNYCRGKLEDVFRDIFLRYPHVRSTSEDADQGIEKPTEDLTEEDRNSVLEDSKQFADDLEKCVFEIYSEPDKHGKPIAASKYKDRFRMLQFNLSKVDRVVLHRRIASGQITPKEISVMSSTDLANEELKQSIKSAEQESLKQSILTKTNAPRTKITHKGLEDIEDVSGRDSTRERERQLEEAERMEKERLARLRTVEPRQRTMSVSAPPESPVAISSEGWGAPPPVPVHALDATKEPHPIRPPLFLHTSSEITTEPELNLADLINIDDDPIPSQGGSSENIQQDPPQVDASGISQSPTGISPFAIQSTQSFASPLSAISPSAPPAAQPPTPRPSVFDLNSLWSHTSNTTPSNDTSTDTKPEANEEKDVVMMDSEPAIADDQDFDMLLEEKEPEKPEMVQASFDALPQVWLGKITMPLDSSIPQESPVVGRQMGGKSIDVTSGQWKTLFPSDTLRIDGRVPVENSAKFLLQMRMNPTKELVAVAFAPAPGSDGSSFKALSDFLINKGRHGLVFPWGNKPKDHHPGKELYIVPLLSSHPLPDYIELLDDLCLPKIRTSDYFIGIWILNKGKLASPPPLPPPPSIPVLPAPFIPDPASVSTPPPPSTSSILPSLPNIANASARVAIDQNALAAELASLTPEQIALVTQALANAPMITATTGSIPAGPSGSQQPIPPTFTQPWGARSPFSHTPGIPPPPSFNPASRGGAGGFSGSENARGRDHRGGGRGRGRGRGDNFRVNSPVDSGWPRKNSGQHRS